MIALFSIGVAGFLIVDGVQAHRDGVNVSTWNYAAAIIFLVGAAGCVAIATFSKTETEQFSQPRPDAHSEYRAG